MMNMEEAEECLSYRLSQDKLSYELRVKLKLKAQPRLWKACKHITWARRVPYEADAFVATKCTYYTNRLRILRTCKRCAVVSKVV